MIGHIVRKELRVNLLSLRFLVGLVVTVLMMGIVGYVLVGDYAARQQTYLSDVQRQLDGLARIKVYSVVGVTVNIPPSPLSVFSRGNKDLPASVHVSPYHIPSLLDEGQGGVAVDLSGTSDRPVNPLLRIFAPIDLVFVISTILSLFAVLLVFDSFSGEREQGTLKLLLSSSTGRVHLLVGKFLGAFLTLAIPLTIGFLEVMLLWALHPRLPFDSSVWIGLIAVYLSSLVFLSSFLSLALYLSLFARGSSSCLMGLLLVWVVVAIVIPAGGGYFAEYFRPSTLIEKTTLDAEQMRGAFLKSYWAIEYRQKGSWNNVSTDPFGGESFLSITGEEAANRMEYNKKAFPLKFHFAEEHFRAVESYAVALRKWKVMRDNLVRPSLCVLYSNIVQTLAGTDIGSFEDVVRQARDYRGALMAYLGPRVEKPEWFTRVMEYPELQPTPENEKYWQSLVEKKGERAVEKILSWDRVAPLDLSSMPMPAIRFAGPLERMGRALADGLILCACAAVFFALSIVRVMRYPVT